MACIISRSGVKMQPERRLLIGTAEAFREKHRRQRLQSLAGGGGGGREEAGAD